VRLGEASPAERAWIDAHLARCARCAEMRASFESHRREVAGAAPARAPEGLKMRLARLRKPWWRGRWVGATLLVPAALATIAVLTLRGSTQAPHEVAPEITVKGGTAFNVVMRRGRRVSPVRAGERLRSGDQIRFVLQHVRYPFVLIASVDGSGHANVYVPYEGKTSVEIQVGDQVEIPGSIVVDESPGPERLFALFSRQPLAAGPVRAALAAIGARGAAAIRNAAQLDVGADDQISFLLEKAGGD